MTDPATAVNPASLGEPDRCLLPALEPELPVDVAEELLVGAREVVGDDHPEYVGDVREGRTGGGVHARFGQRGELGDLGAQRVEHALVDGADHQ